MDNCHETLKGHLPRDKQAQTAYSGKQQQRDTNTVGILCMLDPSNQEILIRVSIVSVKLSRYMQKVKSTSKLQHPGNTSSVPTYSGCFRGDMGEELTMPFLQSCSLKVFSLS